MRRVFVLDDSMERLIVFEVLFKDDELTTAMTASGAISALDAEDKFDIVSLDHDLGEVHSTGMYGVKYERTGLDVVQWMVDEMPKDKRPHTTVVHSWNPSGADVMARVLRKAGFTVIVEPYRTPMTYTKEEEGTG